MAPTDCKAKGQKICYYKIRPPNLDKFIVFNGTSVIINLTGAPTPLFDVSNGSTFFFRGIYATQKI